MRLKLDDKGHVVVIDGKPVYIQDDGRELPFDAAAILAAAKGHELLAREVEGKHADAARERDEARAALTTEKIGTSFAKSKYVAEKLAIPADMARTHFGPSFKFEGDELVAYDRAGKKLLSRKHPGQPAGFDEALSMLIDEYPDRDRILKASGASGGGAQGSGGAGAPSRVLNRSAFQALPPDKQISHIKSGGSVVD